MKFFYQILLTVTLFAFPSLLQAENLEAKKAQEIAERLVEAERDGAGLYFATDIFEDLSVGSGYQFGLNDTFALRFEGQYRIERFIADNGDLPFYTGLRRYGVFLDLGIRDTGSFVYLGSAFNQHDLASGFSVDSGVVWRLRDNFAFRAGHEYRNFADFDGFDSKNHTVRFGVVHW